AAKGRYTEPILLVVWAHAGLLAARNIPIAVIVAAPMAAAGIQYALDRVDHWSVASWVRNAVQSFNRIAAETGENERIPRWHLVSIAGMTLVAMLIFA